VQLLVEIRDLAPRRARVPALCLCNASNLLALGIGQIQLTKDGEAPTASSTGKSGAPLRRLSNDGYRDGAGHHQRRGSRP
jgi:hypothetical protein